MSRQLRILYSGAWYHVMNRGANRRDIFLKVKHRKLFMELLKKISSIYKVEIHAYCLMSNHYHILMRTLEPNLPAAIKYLNSVYTKNFNRDMHRDGPVLRGRYKAILVDYDEYFLHVSRYIHLNPLEAGMVRHLEEYPWSSYPYYVNGKNKPSWLHTDFIFNYFQGENILRQFKDFTAAGNDKFINDFYSEKSIKPILATDQFIDNLDVEKMQSPEISEAKILTQKYYLDEIMSIVEKVTGQSKFEIQGSRRGHTNIPRSIFIYLSRHVGGYKIKEIADYLSTCKYPAISVVLANFSKEMRNDSDLQFLIRLCKMELSGLVKSHH